MEDQWIKAIFLHIILKAVKEDPAIFEIRFNSGDVGWENGGEDCGGFIDAKAVNSWLHIMTLYSAPVAS